MITVHPVPVKHWTDMFQACVCVWTSFTFVFRHHAMGGTQPLWGARQEPAFVPRHLGPLRPSKGEDCASDAQEVVTCGHLPRCQTRVQSEKSSNIKPAKHPETGKTESSNPTGIPQLLIPAAWWIPGWISFRLSRVSARYSSWARLAKDSDQQNWWFSDRLPHLRLCPCMRHIVLDKQTPTQRFQYSTNNIQQLYRRLWKQTCSQRCLSGPVGVESRFFWQVLRRFCRF